MRETRTLHICSWHKMCASLINVFFFLVCVSSYLNQEYGSEVCVCEVYVGEVDVNSRQISTANKKYSREFWRGQEKFN